jgi:hypothetical protein
MNSNVKSLVFNGEEYSDLFLTNVGVRQGVRLHPRTEAPRQKAPQ